MLAMMESRLRLEGGMSQGDEVGWSLVIDRGGLAAAPGEVVSGSRKKKDDASGECR
jgi:hypothetical protein